MANNLTGDIYSPEQMEEMQKLSRNLMGIDKDVPLADVPEIEPITADEKLAMLSMSKEERRRFLTDRKEQAKIKKLRALENI